MIWEGIPHQVTFIAINLQRGAICIADAVAGPAEPLSPDSAQSARGWAGAGRVGHPLAVAGFVSCKTSLLLAKCPTANCSLVHGIGNWVAAKIAAMRTVARRAAVAFLAGDVGCWSSLFGCDPFKSNV